MIQEFVHVVSASRSVAEVVESVKENASRLGFRVLHVHDVAATLADKGFEREPLRIIELCHAPSAHRVLGEDINIGYFIPCKINVYEQNGQVYLGTLRPTMMAQFFPTADTAEVATAIDAALLQIVSASQ